MKRRRVVVTGLGVVAANAVSVPKFTETLRDGTSGIRKVEILRELGFACQVGGIPLLPDSALDAFSAQQRFVLNESMTYAALASLEAWEDAGLRVADGTSWETAVVFGTGVGGMDTIARELVPAVREGRIRRLGSSIVERTMASGVSAFLTGLIGAGGPAYTNSAACCTGTDALVQGALLVESGIVSRALVGSTEGSAPETWAGFDAMRVMTRAHNDAPQAASRPMSASASGFVPSAGAGALVLEDADCAIARKARIYAEVLGASSNSGGQRAGGSITASNPEGIVRCVQAALSRAEICGDAVSYVNGHLTSTGADAKEIRCIAQALDSPKHSFPYVNSTKSLIGHALGAAGAIELVATVIQLRDDFVHASLNADDLHREVAPIAASVPFEALEVAVNVALKTSFGFGDVNACAVLRKWSL